MTKTNSGTDFFTLEAKKVFTYLQKAFTKALVLHHFDLECHICIETNTSKYVVNRVLSLITLDQPLFNHVIYKNHSDFSKSKID